ncbi:hypothetical protein EDF56_11078 [Novosphingobium sp. PhB165]|nr:hypothetical protein EDF56_11078 [Novosphingobium sp. PhB165]
MADHALPDCGGIVLSGTLSRFGVFHLFFLNSDAPALSERPSR